MAIFSTAKTLTEDPFYHKDHKIHEGIGINMKYIQTINILI